MLFSHPWSPRLPRSPRTPRSPRSPWSPDSLESPYYTESPDLLDSPESKFSRYMGAFTPGSSVFPIYSEFLQCETLWCVKLLFVGISALFQWETLWCVKLLLAGISAFLCNGKHSDVWSKEKLFFPHEKCVFTYTQCRIKYVILICFMFTLIYSNWF